MTSKAFSKAEADHVLEWHACLTGFLLQKAVLEIEEKFEAAMSKALEGVSLSFDSWTDLSPNQLMALAVLTAHARYRVRYESQSMHSKGS